MKTTKIKALLILVGLVLVNIQSISAGVIDDVKKTAGNELSNFNMQGILLIGGIVGAGLLIYIISNYLTREKDEQPLGQNLHIGKRNHQRYHNRHIIKKTS